MNAQQLKSSILQLAVSGKLVPQNPADEPAAALLERIRAEKERLIKSGKIKRETREAKIFRRGNSFYEIAEGKERPIDDEIPFEIPESWEWARITTISYSVGTKQNQILSSQIQKTGDYPVVSQGQDLIDGFSNEKEKVIDDLPLVMFGDHTRNVKFIDFKFIVGADGTKFHKIIGCSDRYIYFWMLLTSFNLRNRGYARHYSLLKSEFIPIPPLEEQRRIVEKLETILPLVEKYGDAEKLLDELDAEFPARLKKSVLQLAVSGKLVPQNPADEPAAALLDRIRAEKDRLLRSGKIKRDKTESVIRRKGDSFYETTDKTDRPIDDELPFEIPESWEWCRLSAVGEWGAGATPSKSRPEYYDGNIPWLKTGDLNDGYIDSIPGSISKIAFDETSVKLNPVGSVLIAMYGATIGKLGILNIEATTNQACCACVPFTGVYNKYLFYFLMSHKTAFVKRGEGGAQPNISKEKILVTLIPLPPLAEQKRIVEKIEELLPLIDHLQQ